MAKHTPGPWHVGIKQAEQIVYDPSGWAVANATVYHGKEDLPEMKANARLIAAAPELLEALKAMETAAWVDNDEGLPAHLRGPCEQARAAIAKAEGGK